MFCGRGIFLHLTIKSLDALDRTSKGWGSCSPKVFKLNLGFGEPFCYGDRNLRLSISGKSTRPCKAWYITSNYEVDLLGQFKCEFLHHFWKLQCVWVNSGPWTQETLTISAQRRISIYKKCWPFGTSNLDIPSSPTAWLLMDTLSPPPFEKIRPSCNLNPGPYLSLNYT